MWRRWWWRFLSCARSSGCASARSPRSTTLTTGLGSFLRSAPTCSSRTWSGCAAICIARALCALCTYAGLHQAVGRAHRSSQPCPHPRPKASPGLRRAFRAPHARQGIRIPAGGRPRAAARRGRAACSRSWWCHRHRYRHHRPPRRQSFGSGLIYALQRGVARSLAATGACGSRCCCCRRACALAAHAVPLCTCRWSRHGR